MSTLNLTQLDKIIHSLWSSDLNSFVTLGTDGRMFLDSSKYRNTFDLLLSAYSNASLSLSSLKQTETLADMHQPQRMLGIETHLVLFDNFSANQLS
jgi:hypothetical protein